MRIIVLLALALSAASVQQPRIAGAWALSIEAASGVTDDGGTWSRSALTGALDIEESGSALTGTWTSGKGEPWPLTGQIDGDAFELTTTFRDVPIVIDGQKAAARFRWRFSGTLAGGSMRGSARFERDGSASGSVQPFTGTRRP